MQTDSASGQVRANPFGPILVFGFGAAVALWTAWFVTHVPWTALPDEVGTGVLLAIWLAGMVWAGSVSGLKVAVGAGFTTSVLGLLLIGTRLAPQPEETPSPARPSATLIVLGFLALGIGIGLIGGLLGSVVRRRSEVSSHDWLHRFAFVTVAAAAPLLFIGGLVTSTNSGMAVPDWPRTYGANMFLYPLGQAGTPIFLEHSHRLFGTLVGVTALVLLIWVLAGEPRRWVKVWMIGVGAAICAQAGLGGDRVIRNSIASATVHGILAQLILAGLVCVAVFLWVTPERAGLSKPFPKSRRVRAFATAALHTTLLQLVLGAVYRHLRSPHALWSHVGFSFVVLIAGMLGGFAASAVPRDTGPPGLALRRCGVLMIAAVLLQFLLGWASLGMGGLQKEAPSLGAALIRTAHQANGALLLGLTTAAAVLAKLLYRYVTPAEPATAAA
jgi:Cytochrome oxidase assembly protein